MVIPYVYNLNAVNRFQPRNVLSFGVCNDGFEQDSVFSTDINREKFTDAMYIHSGNKWKPEQITKIFNGLKLGHAFLNDFDDFFIILLS